MKPIPDFPPAVAANAVHCAVVAHGAMRATLDALPALRQRPGSVRGEPLPASFLKHSDEQTVVSLAAVFQAIHQHQLTADSFTDWGVLAGPRFLGRGQLALALQRFIQEGAWGVSPHLIPHRSLHSLSGTVSQALKIHGPNFGVGGGPEAAGEVMLAAAALLSADGLPGVWVVLSGWDPEPVLDSPGKPALNGHRPAPSICGAVALALTLPKPDWEGSRLQVGLGARRQAFGTGAPDSDEPLFSLEAFLGVLQEGRPAASWRLNGGAWLEFERGDSGGGNRL